VQPADRVAVSNEQDSLETDMDDILSLLIPMIGFVCLVAIVHLVVDARVRRRLVETHASEELVRALAESERHARRSGALKWGLVLVASGVGFVLIDVFRLGSENPAAYGLLLACSGAGLLAYHLLQHQRDL
jgi:Mg2+/citrate symporter